MSEQSIMVDLDDPRIEGIADVISNKTCKKILSKLAEKELSESDLSKELKLPLNTVGYNVKKLLDAGLIERSKTFFWSVKGKKIPTYRVSNKRIVISPKVNIKGIVPTILISGALAFLIKVFVGSSNSVSTVANDLVISDSYAKDMAVQEMANRGSQEFAGAGSDVFSGGVYSVINNAPNSWAWFFLGALCGLLVFLVWNYNKYLQQNK